VFRETHFSSSGRGHERRTLRARGKLGSRLIGYSYYLNFVEGILEVK